MPLEFSQDVNTFLRKALDLLSPPDDGTRNTLQSTGVNIQELTTLRAKNGLEIRRLIYEPPPDLK